MDRLTGEDKSNHIFWHYFYYPKRILNSTCFFFVFEQVRSKSTGLYSPLIQERWVWYWQPPSCAVFLDVSSSCLFSSLFSARWTVLWGRRYSIHLRYCMFIEVSTLPLAHTHTNEECLVIFVVIVVFFISQSDSNWWKGTCRGRTGLIPSNYGKWRKLNLKCDFYTVSDIIKHF